MSFNATNVVGGTKQLSDGNHIPMIGYCFTYRLNFVAFEESIDSSVHAALKAGYRLFDTAELYANEAELGNALEKSLPKLGLKREDIFITTKVQTKDGDATNWAEESVKGSLKKLKTDYLDMVLVHFPRDRYTGKDEAYELNKKGRKEVWQKLEELKDRGVIRSIGVSNYEVYHLVELFEYAKVYGINYSIKAFSSLMWGNKEVQQEEIIKEMCKKFDVSPQVSIYEFSFFPNMYSFFFSLFENHSAMRK
ncbi:unnamed protein product [Strongylus vulgaris]|uniref:NADP-dependent oxidoreductase domain-containing protein n=1 Tax=Strongylus vulgaris TaxID=40348 RepID=A0A3P7LMI3_STRVU|nr:unnamed protein product [Strongylus vulgaris]